MPEKRALIVDLDGTIYNWLDFFAPSFRAMVHVLARITQLDEDTIIESFRQVYQRHKSVEYGFSVQELDIWESLKWSPEDIEEKAVKKARGAFRRVREKHFRLYPNVKETLQWARDERLLIIGLSDAPEFQVDRRLKVLRIDRFFDSLHSWKGYDVPDHALKEVLERLEAGEYPESRVSCLKSFDLSGTKPNPETLRSILREFQLSPENVYLVGDSLWKDIGVAQKVGVHDIWARYATQATNKKNIETLLRITPWTEEALAKSQEAKHLITPTYIIDDFSEIKAIIGSRRPTQLTLPI